MKYNQFDIELRHLLDFMNERNFAPHKIDTGEIEITFTQENKKCDSHNPLIEEAIEQIQENSPSVILEFCDKRKNIYRIDIILGNDPGQLVHDCYWHGSTQMNKDWKRFYDILCHAEEQFVNWSNFNDRYCDNIGIGYALGLGMEEASKLA